MAEDTSKTLELLADYRSYVARVRDFLTQDVPVTGKLKEAVYYLADHPRMLERMQGLKHYIPCNEDAVVVPDHLPLDMALMALAVQKRGSAANLMFSNDAAHSCDFADALSLAYRAALGDESPGLLSAAVKKTLSTLDTLPKNLRGNMLNSSLELFASSRGFEGSVGDYTSFSIAAAMLTHDFAHLLDGVDAKGLVATANQLEAEFVQMERAFRAPTHRETLQNAQPKAKALVLAAYAGISSGHRKK